MAKRREVVVEVPRMLDVTQMGVLRSAHRSAIEEHRDGY